ncbi:MAG: SLAC1 anion channel family protein [Bdellovibrio bacteriovorus]
MNDSNVQSRLQFLPVTFFTMVMGLSGLAIAWRRAETVFHLDAPLSEVLLLLAVLSFLVLLVLYGLKLLRFRDAVWAELAHPVQLNFFPSVSISIILIATALLAWFPRAAGALWALGSALHLVLTLYVMGVWIHHQQFEIHHINPAWFLPVVGNVLVPIAGVPLGFVEVSWFYFSVGMVFWLLLFAIILYRVLFHHPLPERLMPTFFILIAPPAVGFIAYIELAGGIDPFARVLYYIGLFLALLLLTQASRFFAIQYYLSWWAYSFPLAAITIATFAMFEQTGLGAFAAIAWVLLTLVTLMVLYLLYRTFEAVRAKSICTPSS